MPASTLTTFDDLAEQIGKAVHNWGTATLKLALSNTAPVAGCACGICGRWWRLVRSPLVRAPRPRGRVAPP